MERSCPALRNPRSRLIPLRFSAGRATKIENADERKQVKLENVETSAPASCRSLYPQIFDCFGIQGISASVHPGALVLRSMLVSRTLVRKANLCQLSDYERESHFVKLQSKANSPYATQKTGVSSGSGRCDSILKPTPLLAGAHEAGVPSPKQPPMPPAVPPGSTLVHLFPAAKLQK